MRLSNTTARARTAATLLAAVSLLACAAAFAQSGRRPPRTQEIAPVPTPTPEPTPPPRADPADTRIPLLVLSGDPHYFHLTRREQETVQAVAVARLRESKSLEVSAEERSATRSDATRRAKESKGRHVVWLELRPDSGHEASPQRLPPERMVIEYAVIEPGTGKLKAGGRVYLQRAYGPVGRVGLPNCYPVLLQDIEYALGALEVAERVMEHFSLPPPRRCS